MCLNVGWYLNVDMQIFFISMIILLIYKTRKLLSKIILWAIMIICFLISIIYSSLANVKIISDICGF
jgi:hypothetical protein